jgi:type VI secretion system secreted protein VgrG
VRRALGAREGRTMTIEAWFACEGVEASGGPWLALRVLEVRGDEEMNCLFSFEVELGLFDDGPPPTLSDLVGRCASLRFATRTTPSFRLVHGIVGAAEEVADVDGGARLRVTLCPHVSLATMMKKSAIHLDKTLLQIIEETLTRRHAGAALERASGLVEEDDGDLARYRPPRATFAIRCIEQARLSDPLARPYCVQYDESDFDFVCRLLEEEGIAYHFEHTPTEAILVLSDFDGGRAGLPPELPLGPATLGRELDKLRLGQRLRPRSLSLTAYNWRKPGLDLFAGSHSEPTEFHTHEHTGRYDHSRATGEELARRRFERLETEREWFTASGHCRLLSAGTVFSLDHPSSRYAGRYLATRVRHHYRQRGGHTDESDIIYQNEVEGVRAGDDALAESRFRPALATPRPRIWGSQTAFVTADPTAGGAEIHLGGPEDVGCVRLRFHWDRDHARLAREPSSCWVRVSHAFAGQNHGALWHPRVGDEVIVEHLDGDPDRPIVTGRVYNGIRKPAENPKERPTWSALKSFTSPHDGNFNMLAFEDQRGAEEVVLHAARDFNTNVERSANTAIGLHDHVHVRGDQSVLVEGDRTLEVGGTDATTAGKITVHSSSTTSSNAAAKMSLTSPIIHVVAGNNLNERAPWIDVDAATKLREGAPEIEVNAGANYKLSGPWIDIQGGSKIREFAPITEIQGDALLHLGGATVLIQGGEISINVDAGEVRMHGGHIGLNS